MRKFSNLITIISAVTIPAFDPFNLELSITDAKTAATAAFEKATTATTAAATATQDALLAKSVADKAKIVCLEAVTLVSTALEENTSLDNVTLALNEVNTTLLGKTIGDLALLDSKVVANKTAINEELTLLADDLVDTFTKIDTNFRTVGIAV